MEYTGLNKLKTEHMGWSQIIGSSSLIICTAMLPKQWARPQQWVMTYLLVGVKLKLTSG